MKYTVLVADIFSEVDMWEEDVSYEEIVKMNLGELWKHEDAKPGMVFLKMGYAFVAKNFNT